MNGLSQFSRGRIMRRAMPTHWSIVVVALAIVVLPLVAIESAIPAVAGPRLARVMMAIGLPSSEPIIGVAALQRRIARDPHAWDGRTVRVYGVVVSYRSRINPFTWVTRRLFVDACAQDGSAGLPVVDAPTAPALLWLQRLPLIGRLLAGPLRVQWYPSGHLLDPAALTDAACCAGHSYEAAVLLGAPSGSVDE